MSKDGREQNSIKQTFSPVKRGVLVQKKRHAIKGKERKLVPWHGTTSREPNTAPPGVASRNRPTGPKCSLSLAAPLLPPPEMDGSGSWDAIDWNQIEVRLSSSAPRATVPTPRPTSPTHAPASACAPALRAPSSLPGRGLGLGIRRGARVCRSRAHAPPPRPRERILFPCLRLGWSELWEGLRFDAPLPFIVFEGSEAAEAWPRRQGQHGRLPARGRGGIRPGNLTLPCLNHLVTHFAIRRSCGFLSPTSYLIRSIPLCICMYQ
jgi:hypothetical protein